MESIARNQVTAAQIQRLEDAAQNPLTGKAWPQGHQNILPGRRDDFVKRNWTQVPQLLVYDEYESELQIACTQPHRLAITELTTRVADEMGVTLGEEVGYQIGGVSMVNMNKQKKTRLSYMTEGVLLRQLGTDKNLSAYACVVIDEVHERTVDLDLLPAPLKRAISRREDSKDSSPSFQTPSRVSFMEDISFTFDGSEGEPEQHTNDASFVIEAEVDRSSVTVRSSFS
ncbi:Pre-mRNA-splicing factor ATP-dependent RNA helicase PRP43 [Trichoderma lentiforme]|uniref:Pre-mRNA-splicing factor ATP-dependent RNA helicase PRP43 n=1 Tax=Trichoderma lentiforme TaxID=1567552 RepID=A0A9P4XGQ8_9HYPO|nr:Pre-mRNA-splicing factor ATP-dependent RNA helicase PRP43 [Trichoderma lentiforme]